MKQRPESRLFVYHAQVYRVVDGDTLHALVDLGFRRYSMERLRLTGIDTPELRKEQLAAGLVAKTAVIEWVERHGPEVWIESGKQPGGYDRWSADVWSDDGTHLNGWLLAEGLAKPSQKSRVEWSLAELAAIAAWRS